jgi:membrane protein implicated in regulation of membrane protease activity
MLMLELFDIVSNLNAYIWLFVALGLLLLELSAPGLFFFIAFAFGSFCAFISAFFGFCLLVQLWTALFGGSICFIVIKAYFATHKIKSIESKTNVDALIGREGLVIEAIGLHQSGQVKIRGELWGAVLKDGSILQKGTFVRVVDIQGNKVVVRSLS